MEARFPPNPIRVLRESLALSQKELAELAGVSPQRVLREEQFVYEKPCEGILRALSERAGGYSKEALTTQYIAAREKLHAEFALDLIDSPFYMHYVREAFDYATDYFDALSELRSPTRLFREYLFEKFGLPTSAVKFSTYTGMHPATLSDIETGKTDWDGADALKSVLLEALAIPSELVDQLGTLHDNYFMRKV